MQVQINPETREAHGKSYSFIPLAGYLDETNLPSFSEAIDPLLEKDHTYLVFDLGNLDLLNSHAVGYFKRIHERSQAIQKKIAFINMSEELREILELVGLVELIATFDEEEKFLEAVANEEI